jgi:hypothetical protein
MSLPMAGTLESNNGAEGSLSAHESMSCTIALYVIYIAMAKPISAD